ncbi:MAG: MBL fold metallo-hydrolase [Fimbriimonadaceae bacterium]|nr:MBL fold metallo-hydrolase [Chitinophagales bacterium]
MSVFIASLNSGSNANCYYVGNRSEAVLIDAGLSCRETEKRMKQLGLDMQKVKAVFISHEHTDHINGLERLHKTFQLPVYITPQTFLNCNLNFEQHLVNYFTRDSAVQIGALTILPFSKSHDANDPHSFMISCYEIFVGVITDIGYACEEVINCFKKCDAVFLEANYCEEMLANGNYPFYLKKRISSNMGHLSNAQALEVFLKYRSDKLQLLILSHLSKNNNTPQLVNKLFSDHGAGVQIIVASRDKGTDVFEITTAKKLPALQTKKTEKKYQEQLSLF